VQEKLYQLVIEGYCIFTEIIRPDLLERLHAAADRALSSSAFDKDPTNQGAIAGISYREPAFLDLITWPGALDLMRHLGFAHPRSPATPNFSDVLSDRYPCGERLSTGDPAVA
jgi:hypothetical protein